MSLLLLLRLLLLVRGRGRHRCAAAPFSKDLRGHVWNYGTHLAVLLRTRMQLGLIGKFLWGFSRHDSCERWSGTMLRQTGLSLFTRAAIVMLSSQILLAPVRAPTCFCYFHKSCSVGARFIVDPWGFCGIEGREVLLACWLMSSGLPVVGSLRCYL